MSRSTAIRCLPVLLLTVFVGYVGADEGEEHPARDRSVVLYCGIDAEQGRQIADLYQQETGTTVLYQGENRSQRSIGLPQKIRDEKANPRADVFWSSEILNMVDLAGRGLLDSLPHGVDDAFPPPWRDPNRYYVAFGARARVFLVNTELLRESDYPSSLEDLLDPKYKKMGLVTCMARPLTGTTYTHAVALLTRSEADGRRFLDGVAEAAVDGRLKLVQSNGRAMREARDAENKVAFCLTDTDDAWVAIREGDPVTVVYPDQGEGKPGSMLIPNTVALIKGHPHPEEAVALLTWLVSAESEARLAAGPSALIPLRSNMGGATVPAHVKRPDVDFRAMQVDWQQVAKNRTKWMDYLSARFRPSR